jgi:hypothetical protein
LFSGIQGPQQAVSLLRTAATAWQVWMSGDGDKSNSMRTALQWPYASAVHALLLLLLLRCCVAALL